MDESERGQRKRVVMNAGSKELRAESSERGAQSETGAGGALRGKTWGWWIAVAVVVLLGSGLRTAHYRGGYGHPDEAITVHVVGHMRQSGDLDTNWAKATNLEAGLRYDQYNFSAHLYATYWFYRCVKLVPGTEGWRTHGGGAWVYRFLSVLLASVAVWQTWRLAGRLGGRAVAIVAALVAAVAVQLVQDAHYSRPEAFVTVLTLAAVALCWPRSTLSVAAVTGGAAVIGVLVACKVSMLLLGWLPLVPVVAAWRSATARERWMALGLVPVAVVAGFAVGAPGAVARPEIFLSGVRYLMEQYAGAHPPHSHPDGGAVADLLGAYYAAALGWPALVCGAWGAVVLVRGRRWAELALVAGPVVVFAGYFATKGVFFERNLSHVVPLALVLVAVGAVAGAAWIARQARLPVWTMMVAVGALLVLPALRVTVPLVSVEYAGEGTRQRHGFEEALRARHAGVAWRDAVLTNDGPLVELREHFARGGGPVLLRAADYNDAWTAFNRRLLLARFDVAPVAEFPGTFPELPVCTLHTYNSPRVHYFLVRAFREW